MGVCFLIDHIVGVTNCMIACTKLHSSTDGSICNKDDECGSGMCCFKLNDDHLGRCTTHCSLPTQPCLSYADCAFGSFCRVDKSMYIGNLFFPF